MKVKRQLDMLHAISRMSVLIIFLLGSVNGYAYRYRATLSGQVNDDNGGTICIGQKSDYTECNNGDYDSGIITKTSYTHQYYVRAEAKPGYKFDKWSDLQNCSIDANNYNYTDIELPVYVVCARNNTDLGKDRTNATIKANFIPVEVNSLVSVKDENSKTLDRCDECDGCIKLDLVPSNRTYECYITFKTSNANHDDTDDFDINTKTSGSGTFTVKDWSRSGDEVSIQIIFTDAGKYGDDRNNVCEITLTSKATTGFRNETDKSKTCTICAKYDNVEIINGNAKALETTFNDSEQKTIEDASATFNVKWVDGIENFIQPNISNNPYFTLRKVNDQYLKYEKGDDGNGTVTVYYSYNGNYKETGDNPHTATLTLKAIGDLGGQSKDVTLIGYNHRESDDDVEVIYNGTSKRLSWVDGLQAANNNDGSTIKLLRDVNLDNLDKKSHQTFISSTILDLNSFTLSGTVSNVTTAINTRLLYLNNPDKTLTIKDSGKSGTGKIVASSSTNAAQYAIQIAQGNLIIESGTIEMTNSTTGSTNYNTTAIYISGISTFTMNGGTINATHNAKANYAYGIYALAGSILNINGGEITTTTGLATDGTSSYGIYITSDATSKSVLTFNNGTINSTAYGTAYGIFSNGADVNINGGNINANTTVSTQARALYICGADAKTSEGCYYGTLNMTGGVLKATSFGNNAYGIYADSKQTEIGNGQTGQDGSFTNKAAPILNITGGTIYAYAGTEESTKATTAVGIYTNGCYNSLTNSYHTDKIENVTIYAHAKTGNAYGVHLVASTANNNADCSMWSDAELNNVTIDARTTLSGGTVYGVYVMTASGTRKSAYSDGKKYASASKATLNNCTVTVESKEKDAYAVCGMARAKVDYNVNLEYHPEDYPEARVELNINGGKYSATTGISGARAVSSGGITKINGGEFSAYATTTTAYAFYATDKMSIVGAKVTKVSSSLTETTADNSNSLAIGVYADASAGNKDNNPIEFAYAADVEVINSTFDNIETRRGNVARGVYVEAKQRAGVAIAANALVDGCTFYKVTASYANAYGIHSAETTINKNSNNEIIPPASPTVVVKNSTFNVNTNKAIKAYGFYSGGYAQVSNCNFNVTAGTTTSYGIYAYDKDITIDNTKIVSTATSSAYGIYGGAKIDNKYGYKNHANIELNDGNDVLAQTTNGNEAYCIYLHAHKDISTTAPFAGDYATAATAVINGGKYWAEVNGDRVNDKNGVQTGPKTAYAIWVQTTQTQNNASATPECTINGGFFRGTAPVTYADINANGTIGYFNIKGGIFTSRTNADNYVVQGYRMTELESTRDEYKDDYRYEILDDETGGNYVCQINTTKYKTLEGALQFVNQNPTQAYTIFMLADYTLPAGSYTLPSKATLLIPYKSGTGAGATTAIGSTSEKTSENVTNSRFRKLTFAEGVFLDVLGTIEVASRQYGTSSNATGIQKGAYAQLHLEEGSFVQLESTAKLMAWGYITGKGEIDAKKGSTVYEDFQIWDMKGGGPTSQIINRQSSIFWEYPNHHLFPITHYSYQNIEAPIIYRPGSSAIGSAYADIQDQDQTANVKIIGNSSSGALFQMEDVDESSDTWVRKEFDPSTDKMIYTLNNGAKLGNLDVRFSAADIQSKDYILPISSNMRLIMKYGTLKVAQNTYFMPGSELIIEKEASLYISSGQELYFVDKNDWEMLNNQYIWITPYSPSFHNGIGGAGKDYSPRKDMQTKNNTLESAELFVHGNIIIDGSLYTSPAGANIHSINGDAGKVTFNNTITNKIFYQCTATGEGGQNDRSKTCGTLAKAKCALSTCDCYFYDVVDISCTSAQLKNGIDNNPQYTTTSSGTYIYKNDMWVKVYEEGCFTIEEIAGVKHEYAYPSEFVEVVFDIKDNTYTDAATGTHKYIWDADCVWWEVDPMSDINGSGNYKAIKADHNGNYNYYEYDAESDNKCWKKKTVKVTWDRGDDGKIVYTVGYGTQAKYNGALPKKTSTDLKKYTYVFTGWKDENDNFYADGEDLPTLWSDNMTFTAQFEEKKYMYSITFKNEDGKTIDRKDYYAGDWPECSKTPTKEPTNSKEYVFKKWHPDLRAVDDDCEYTAEYDTKTRSYTISFVNYNRELLYSADFEYGSEPKYNYSKGEPFRDDNNSFSYTFAGWKSESMTEVIDDRSDNANLPPVEGVTDYVAQYNQSKKTYRVNFITEGNKEDFGKSYEYGTTPEYGYTGENGLPLKKPSDYIDEDNITIFQCWESSLDKTHYYEGEQLPEVTAATTYTALYYKHSNYVLDIVDWESNNGTPTAIIINTQNFASSGWPYTISINDNYKTYGKDARNKNRTLTLSLEDFGLKNTEKNDKLTIEIRNKDNNLVGGHYTYVPYIFDGNGTYTNGSSNSINSIVYVHSGELKITGNAQTNTIQANTIYVSPQAQLTILEGATLTVGNLLLRTTPSAAAVLDIKGALDIRDKKDIIYYTRILDNEGGASQYYQLGLPLPVNIDDVSLSLGTKPEYNAAWLLKYYDTQKRAEKGTNGENWVAVTDGQIKAGVGYEMFSLNNYYTEYYFPVRLTNLTNEIDVKYAYDPTTGDNHAGWNVISSPLLNAYSNEPINDPTTVLKFSRLTADGIVEQEAPEHIMPAIVYSYQAAQDETSIIFNSSSAAGIAPRWQTADEVMTQTEWLPIRITNNDKQRDEVSFFVHPTRFGDGYEIGIDVAKQSLTANRPLIYSSMPYGDMAFAGVSDDDMMAGVALTTYSPNKQQVTFSLRDNKFLDRLANVYLKDTYAGSMTDLLMFNYTTSLYAGTTQDRFYIMAIFKSQVNTTPTDINGVDNLDLVVWSVQKQIYVNTTDIGSTIYCFDATGRLVDSKLVTEKTVVFNVPTAGVYIIKSADKVKRTIAY